MPVHKSRLQDACAPNSDDSFLSQFGWPEVGAGFATAETMRLALDMIDLIQRLRELRRLRDALDNWLRSERHWLDNATAADDPGAEPPIEPQSSRPAEPEAAAETAAAVNEPAVADPSGHRRRRRKRTHRTEPDGQ
jgi:hypothetical protein